MMITYKDNFCVSRGVITLDELIKLGEMGFDMANKYQWKIFSFAALYRHFEDPNLFILAKN